MAVVENASVDLGINVGSSTSSRNFDTIAAAPESLVLNDVDQTKQTHLGLQMVDPNSQQNNNPIVRSHTHDLHTKVQQFQQQQHKIQIQHSLDQRENGMQNHQMGGTMKLGVAKPWLPLSNGNGDGGEGFKRDMRELEELLSKLNPMAEEFVPLSLANRGSGNGFYTNNIEMNNGTGNGNSSGRRKKNNYGQGKRRTNSRTNMAQQEEVIRRTVYVSDIDQQVTEEQLASLFINCGQVVDCRICGDPHSILRFAFIEFTDEDGARAALSLAGTVLGYYPVRVLPSKTAIAPVNPTFLPRTEDEREMCTRTIYCTNIDKKISQEDVKLFFESYCGEVYRLRLLGDYHHSTRIAFVEFVMAESAIAALSYSGMPLGSLQIRVSPSKTPVRPRTPRPQMH